MRRTILLSGVLPFTMAVLGTVVATSFLWPARGEAQPTIIRAEQVTVIGDNGVDRVRLVTGPGGNAALVVLGADGVRRANVNVGAGLAGPDPDAAGLTVWARDGVAPRASLRTLAGGASALLLRDQEGQDRLSIRVDADGTPSIELLDAAGNVTWSAP